MQSREVLHGCAFDGTAHTVMQIGDTVAIAHGPGSCAFLSVPEGMVSAARRVLNRYGTNLSHCFVPALRCSDMDERVVISGATKV